MSNIKKQSILGAILCIIFLLEGYSRVGKEIFIFLTIWVVILQLFTFLSILLSPKYSHIKNTLIVTSWNLGWLITILFWFYIYPQIKDIDPTPIWSQILSHGLVHFQMVFIFLKSKFPIQNKHYLLTLFTVLIYLFGCVVPLKYFYESTIYPKFFEEVWPTVIYIAAALGLTSVFFVFGKRLNRNKNKLN